MVPPHAPQGAGCLESRSPSAAGRQGRGSMPFTAQGVRKTLLSGKAVDPASTRGTFQRQLLGRKSDSLLIVIIVTAAATTDCIHHSLH